MQTGSGGEAGVALAGEPGSAAVRQWIAQAAARHPDKPYVVSVEDGRELRYRELADFAARLSSGLAARGIGANDRVVLLSGNSIEHLAVYAAVLAAGATICTIHVEMNRGHFDTILPALGARLVLYEEGLGLESLAGAGEAAWCPLGSLAGTDGHGFVAGLPAPAGVAPAPAAGNADAVVFYTSGTSARPKGVVWSYGELVPNAVATAAAFELGPGDRIYDYRSFNWASAQILSGLATLSVGATLLLGRRFSRSRFFSDIGRFGATVVAGNPTVLGMLLQGEDRVTGRDLPRLRFIISSSAPLLVEDWKRFEERFAIPVAQGYGSSETGWIAGSTDRTRRHGTVGRPLPYLCLAIVARDGRPLPSGEVGYVEVGGPGDHAYRYLDDDGRVRVHASGRIRTGDMGFLDADGYLHLTGREKELVIRGGVNISPLEVDNVLLGMPGIVEAATIGVPDRIYGEEVVSFVVTAPGAAPDAAAILAHCASRLPAAKAPKRIIFRATLPKTERGKLDRKALARAWTELDG